VARREKLDLVITEAAPSGAKAEEPALHLRR
jgi:hypothetical protein